LDTVHNDGRMQLFYALTTSILAVTFRRSSATRGAPRGPTIFMPGCHQLLPRPPGVIVVVTAHS
jgi:hypothetical protein